MRFYKRTDADEFGIDIAPLIDVVFLLLIFFMVTTTFNHTTVFGINLPAAQTRPTAVPMHAVIVAINKQGAFYVDGAALPSRNMSLLSNAIRHAFAKAGPKAKLIIRADAMTSYQNVVTAMNAARHAGVTHMAIAIKRIKRVS